MMYKLLKLNPSAGLTLIEMLAITVVVGIIAAIGIPSWLNFLNEQRLKQVNEEIHQILETTQTKAKKTSQAYTVRFQVNNDTFQYAEYPSDQTTSNLEWKYFTSDTKGLALKLTQGDSMIFSYNGSISSYSSIRANEKITLHLAGVTGNPRSCVIVQTLLGSLKTGEDAECNQ